ncbi:antibiotic biosynthesis monooxygenase [Oceanobacillus sp. HCA-5259]
MNAYMTNGTIDFLLQMEKKHEELDLKLMENNAGGLLYYEHPTKEIFQSGRKYEILEATGEIQQRGYVVMNNIPVAEESRALFEDRFKRRKHSVEAMPGFQAFRVLRPYKGTTYVILTQWSSKKDFEYWKASGEFQEAHELDQVKPSSYLFKNTYLATYDMYVEEEEE